MEPCLPPDDYLTEELTGTHWKFQSDGSIIIEKKDEIIKRSPDRSDSLALTFWTDVSTGEDAYDDLRGLL